MCASRIKNRQTARHLNGLELVVAVLFTLSVVFVIGIITLLPSYFQMTAL